MPTYALNQVTARSLSFEGFLDLAAELGCVGVEPRDDLDRPLFDGLSDARAAQQAADRGLRILGLNQVWPFDVADAATDRAIDRLAGRAAACGARCISLIPRIDREPGDPAIDDVDQLARRLETVAPILERHGVVGLVESLGFPGATLQDPWVAVQAIEKAGVEAHVELVIDTFQATFAGGWDTYAPHSGLLQISGIDDPVATFDADLDQQRGAIGPQDRVGNVAQIQRYLDQGYTGALSFECTSDALQQQDLATVLRRSIDWLDAQLVSPAG